MERPGETAGPAGMAYQAATPVPSVGPYTFRNSGRGSGTRASCRGYTVSPPKTTIRIPPIARSRSASTSAWKAVGVMLIRVTADAAIREVIARGSNGSGARCSRAPAKRGARRLRCVRWKLKEVTTRSVSRSEIRVAPMYQWTRFDTARCTSCTPLGRPVEPEV